MLELLRASAAPQPACSPQWELLQKAPGQRAHPHHWDETPPELITPATSFHFTFIYTAVLPYHVGLAPLGSSFMNIRPCPLGSSFMIVCPCPVPTLQDSLCFSHLYHSLFSCFTHTFPHCLPPFHYSIIDNISS